MLKKRPKFIKIKEAKQSRNLVKKKLGYFDENEMIFSHLSHE